MKRFLILILGLSLTAASCDIISSTFNIQSGAKGVFRSEDAGDSFHAANRLVNKGDISNVTVNSLAFDPSNSEVLYLASGNGIYKSEDAAKTWHYTLSGIATADIAVDPFNPQVIYASGLTGQNGKIIKSLDGGTSWVDIYTEPSKNNTVLTVTVARSSSATILAGLVSGEVLRSFDSGHTWQATKELGDRVSRIRFGTNGAAYALTLNKGVYKSLDFGVSWTSISNTLITDSISSSGSATATASVFYDLALDRKQPGVLYLGTDKGLFRTVNDGGNWAFIKMPVKDALRVSSISVDPGSSNVLYAAIGSTVFKSVNGSVTWETKVLPTTAEVRTILINPESRNLVYLGLGARR